MKCPNHYRCHGLLELETIDPQDCAGIEGHEIDDGCYRLELDGDLESEEPRIWIELADYRACCCISVVTGL